jgi:hypothetical protein
MSIADNVTRVRERIAAAASRVSRSPLDITLVAITKTVEPIRIQEAVHAGVLDLGENYYQEARDKIPLLGPEIRWHFTGHLQSNKAKYVAGAFALIHSLDSLSLAQEIGRRAAARNKVQSVLIEVKLDPSDTKRGIAPEETYALVEQAGGISGIRVCGLMGMAPYAVEPEESRPFFARLRRLYEQLPIENRQILSMGMSGDFEVAVEEGATHVRIGTAIFGLRS